jgi:hypothetical protein
MSSVIAILAVLFLTLLFAYMGWWETVLRWLPDLAVHMNFGSYVSFPSLCSLQCTSHPPPPLPSPGEIDTDA